MQLTTGQKFKNYKELCLFLGEEPKQGNSKIAQMERWQRFFRWEKNKFSLTITEVIMPYSNLGINEYNSKWSFPITRIILAELHKILKKRGSNTLSNEYKELIVVSNDLYKIIGFCNNKFKALKGGTDKIEVDFTEQKRAYVQIADKFYHILDSILKSLHTRHVIHHERSYVVTFGEEKAVLAEYDDKVKIHLLVGELLKKFSCQTEYMLLLRNKEIEFYKELNDTLLEKYGITSCYKVHRIAFSEKSLERLEELFVSPTEQESYQIEVNRKAYDDLKVDNVAVDLLDFVIPYEIN